MFEVNKMMAGKIIQDDLDTPGIYPSHHFTTWAVSNIDNIPTKEIVSLIIDMYDKGKEHVNAMHDKEEDELGYSRSDMRCNVIENSTISLLRNYLWTTHHKDIYRLPSVVHFAVNKIDGEYDIEIVLADGDLNLTETLPSPFDEIADLLDGEYKVFLYSVYAAVKQGVPLELGHETIGSLDFFGNKEKSALTPYMSSLYKSGGFEETDNGGVSVKFIGMENLKVEGAKWSKEWEVLNKHLAPALFNVLPF